MGVTVTRAALVANTRAVSQACGYDRGKVIVSLIDPKREVLSLTMTLDNLISITYAEFRRQTSPGEIYSSTRAT